MALVASLELIGLCRGLRRNRISGLGRLGIRRIRIGIRLGIGLRIDGVGLLGLLDRDARLGDAVDVAALGGLIARKGAVRQVQRAAQARYAVIRDTDRAALGRRCCS